LTHSENVAPADNETPLVFWPHSEKLLSVFTRKFLGGILFFIFSVSRLIFSPSSFISSSFEATPG